MFDFINNTNGYYILILFLLLITFNACPFEPIEYDDTNTIISQQNSFQNNQKQPVDQINTQNKQNQIQDLEKQIKLEQLYLTAIGKKYNSIQSSKNILEEQIKDLNEKQLQNQNKLDSLSKNYSQTIINESIDTYNSLIYQDDMDSLNSIFKNKFDISNYEELIMLAKIDEVIKKNNYRLENLKKEKKKTGGILDEIRDQIGSSQDKILNLQTQLTNLKNNL